jgi:N-acetylglucosamine-6-phosphate deacetylase
VHESGVVLIEGGTIVQVGDVHDVQLPADCEVLSEGGFVIPGLIDLHCHGTRLHDALAGTAEALTAMAIAQARAGVTGFLPTIATAPWSTMVKAVETVGRVRGAATGGAAILGAHVEGPFLSKKYPGAQSPDCFLEPTIDRVREMLAAGDGAVRMMTLAPELPGALDVIAELVQQQIVPAMGHTAATFEQAMAAVEAGCRYSIHSFNAMPGLDGREPATIGAALFDDRVTAELLCDCVHVHPAMMKILIQSKAGRACLGTDLIAAQQYHPADYGSAYAGESYLATNTTFLDQAVRNVVNFLGISLADAVAMASTAPAHIIHIGDRKGSLAPGKDADVVVLDENYYPTMTIVGGEPVFRTKHHADGGVRP